MAVALIDDRGEAGSAQVAIYDVEGEKPKLDKAVTVSGTSGAVLAVSPSGSFVAVGMADEGVQLVDARTGALGARLPIAGLSSLAFAPDGQRLAVATRAEGAARVVVVDAQGGAELFHSPPVDQPVVGLTFTADGLILVGALAASGVGVAWDVDAGRELFRMPEDATPSRAGGATAASADGLTYATADATWVEVWEVDGHQRIARIDVGCVPASLALNRDGSVLLVGGPDASAWSVASGARLGALGGPGIVAVHPDNERFVLAGRVAKADGPPLARIRDALFPSATIE